MFLELLRSIDYAQQLDTCGPSLLGNVEKVGRKLAGTGEHIACSIVIWTGFDARYQVVMDQTAD